MAPTPVPPVPPLPPVPMTDEWLSPIDRIAAALEEMRDGSPLTGQPRANLDQLLAEAYSGINWTSITAAVALIVAVVALALVLRHRHVAVTNPAFALSQPVVDDESLRLALAVSVENRQRIKSGLTPLPEPVLPVTTEGGDPR